MANGSIAERVAKRQDKDGMLRRSLERIVQLYTDKAHFIYELLQNAEDAGATKITFLQYPDQLVVIHDGRPFSEINLDGLCDIGKSDKINDLNQIGEFGVGFKSVFGICDTVRLYSHPDKKALAAGYEQFAVEIQDFTNPVDTQDKEINIGYTTRFEFPYSVGHTYSSFDSVDKLNQTLSARLQNLGITTLLFMKNLKLIDYRIDLPELITSGTYLLEKDEINDHCALVSAIGQTDQDKAGEEISYLVFTRPIDASNERRTIDIAFPVKSIDSGMYNFIPSKYLFISVYFPTETKSELKFIVQGPYRTTPNRSSVPSDQQENIALAQKTAKLLRDSILELRDENKLNYSLLSMLPLSEEPFESSPLFRCVYDETLKMMMNEDVLIRNSGGYACSKNVKIPRGTDFTEIITDDLLTELINDKGHYYWLPGFFTGTHAQYDDLFKYLTEKLGIGLIRPDSWRGLLLRNPEFLKNRTNEWLIRFYNMLSGTGALFAKEKGAANMLTVPFVKTEDGDFIAPYRKSNGEDEFYIFAVYNGSAYLPNVFLPSPVNKIPGVKYVNSEIFRSCKQFFIEILGLESPDEYAHFMGDFKRRYDGGAFISDDQHITDLKHLLRYRLNTNYKDEVDVLIDKYLRLKCVFAGKKQYIDPKQTSIYFSSNEDGLSISAYYEHVAEKCYIDDAFYTIEGISREDLRSLGVIDDISVGANKTSGEYKTKDRGQQPKWNTLDDFRWKLSLDRLDAVLEYICFHPEEADAREKSKYILWFIQKNLYRLKGNVHLGGNNRPLINEYSDIVKLLRQDEEYKHMSYGSKWDGKWLYTASGQLVSQNEITRHDLDAGLYNGISLEDNLFIILGFKKDKDQILKEATAEYDQLSEEKQDQFFEIAFMRKFGMSSKEFMTSFGEQLSLFSEKQAKDNEGVFNFDEDALFEFPTARVKNWDTLRKHAAEALCFADPVKYRQKLISIRVSRPDSEIKAYLQGMYRDGDSFQYACQMCHKPFPKINRCQLAKNMEKELDAMYLSMCPNCEAKYKTLWNDDRLMERFIQTIEKLRDSDIDRPGEPVKILLGDESIWFSQIHVAEIRELLNLEHAVENQHEKHDTMTRPAASSRKTADNSDDVRSEKKVTDVFRDERVVRYSQDNSQTVVEKELPKESSKKETKTNAVITGADIYKKYIGKRIHHKTKGYGVITSADEKYFGIHFDTAKHGQADSLFSIEMCLNKGLITLV